MIFPIMEGGEFVAVILRLIDQNLDATVDSDVVKKQMYEEFANWTDCNWWLVRELVIVFTRSHRRRGPSGLKEYGLKELNRQNLLQLTVPSGQKPDKLKISTRHSHALALVKAYLVEDSEQSLNYFSIKQCCGIYVLYFTNDEYYVGQTVDVIRRFMEHRKAMEILRELALSRWKERA